MLFNIDLNVFTVLADFICSGILFQIGVLSEGKVSCLSKQWVLLKESYMLTTAGAAHHDNIITLCFATASLKNVLYNVLTK